MDSLRRHTRARQHEHEHQHKQSIKQAAKSGQEEIMADNLSTSGPAGGTATLANQSNQTSVPLCNFESALKMAAEFFAHQHHQQQQQQQQHQILQSMHNNHNEQRRQQQHQQFGATSQTSQKSGHQNASQFSYSPSAYQQQSVQARLEPTNGTELPLSPAQTPLDPVNLLHHMAAAAAASAAVAAASANTSQMSCPSPGGGPRLSPSSGSGSQQGSSVAAAAAAAAAAFHSQLLFQSQVSGS